MFAVELLFCISFIVGSRADSFDFNNLDGLTVSVVDQNNKQIYYSKSSMGHVGWTPDTDYVTVTAINSDGNEEFTKDFRTSINGNSPMCNYAVLLSEHEGNAHYRSSLSSKGCTNDENTTKYDLVVFDNGSDHPFNPSFAKSGEGFAPDSIHGWMDPGSIRVYSTDDVYLSSPAVDIDSGDEISTAAYDPYTIDFMTCTTNRALHGQIIVTYRKDNNGDYKCTEVINSEQGNGDTWKENILYEVGDVAVYRGETWKARYISYGFPPDNYLWEKISPAESIEEETALAKENERLRKANKALRKALTELAA